MSQKTKHLVYTAVFIAIAVIASSFLTIIVSQSVRISFTPIVVMLCGAVLGPVFGAAAGAATDVLSYLLVTRVSGAYFPAFTVTMMLYGLLAGLLFHKRENSTLKIALGVTGIQTGCSLLLNTFWNSVLYGTPYFVMMATRVPATYINCAIYVVILCLLIKNRCRIFKNIWQPAAGSGYTG
ncbi:MAG TPA: hypothetical protein DEB31_00085 [Clostridiales bacterium]|nr:hypothetical protein [Clostridiales bacterium]